MKIITLKYYNGSSWLSFTYYYTDYKKIPEINKISGITKSGEKYQFNLNKRYSYTASLLLSAASPYSTTLANQISFLYNFLSSDSQIINTIDPYNIANDIDVVTAENGLIQLDLIENSSYIRTITLNFSETDPTTGAF